MDQVQFKEQLKQKGLKLTKQRLLLLETMAKHPGEHLTAEELYDLVKESNPEIGLATVYRNVQVLLDLHVIDKVSFDDGFARYELGGLDGETRHHHHHAICRSCGAVCSFDEDLLDNLEQALLTAFGFQVVDHEVKLFGYCRACRENNKDGNK